MALEDMPGEWTMLGWWWNGSVGERTRRDVWLELNEATGTFRLRWRHGPVYDAARNTHPAPVLTALKDLLGEDKGEHWHERFYLRADGRIQNHHRPTEFTDGTVFIHPPVPGSGSWEARPEA